MISSWKRTLLVNELPQSRRNSVGARDSSLELLLVESHLCSTYVYNKSETLLRRRDPEGKDPQVIENPVRPPDVELATLRELPRRGNFVHNSNALYTTAEIPTDEEIASLLHIRRGQIKLTKFLGSGAFGEVFEGNAHSLVDSSGSETKVAIKEVKLYDAHRHQLMLKCWSYNPESRPTFKYCLDVLLELKDHVSLSDVQNVSRTASSGIENRGFFEDENHNNSSGSSWKTGSDAGSRDQIPILPSNAPGDIPRYLELLYDDSDNTTVSDGYEIPRPPPPSAAVSKTPSATNTLDRHRTLSTSSTVSDSSISYQQALLASPETPVSTNIKRTLSLEPRRNGDTDVSTLQHLLSAQLCTYSNAAEQPLLDAAKVTSLSCSNSFNVTDEHVRT
uniref:receptor protein-tyrosine kinase n=1 Tax=Timema monikensis TaxID=170555 RepID=A0A7R9E4N4_9NEOP|nr:unnamed protein product [Timema monikensis]